ncbi:aldose 1-epimerase [Novosphingobium sediminis]|uniref:Aldose 1-epimerase n=1 Tax=Novosphingobium sediminis TaxID=707214 RepID=A0A512AGE5_9SPHN|nr:aldose 1-epimerase [Novosphingobium sediminis]GEN98760.1 aldose 1-epimerase [Novosphingobium sediminis]
MDDHGLVTLTASDYEVTIAPQVGGSLRSLDWKGLPVLRKALTGHILDAACFPIVPFCNRIAEGRFTAGGIRHHLPSNFPDAYHAHALHGYGWVRPWQVIARDAASIRLVHDYDEGVWPWRYRAEQRVELAADGVRMLLRVTHLGPGVMPAGLGFHPYFPGDDSAVYHGLHRFEWQTSSDGLPLALLDAGAAVDWWQGAPVTSRAVDTIQEGRQGTLAIQRSASDMLIELEPSDLLTCTGVYVGRDGDFFCVEPLSHPTDAINRAPEQMAMLAEGETLEASLLIRARHIPPQDD